MALTTWRYLWRTTALHRREEPGSSEDMEPALPEGADQQGLQSLRDGSPPMFHRYYAVQIEGADVDATELLTMLTRQPNRPSPVEVAVFVKTKGAEGAMAVGDEFVVRMPGPWDGPVRVVERTPTSFRLATLDGHLEAGQIEFRVRDDDGLLTFEIESWASSGDRLSKLLYHRLHIAKEMQLHMWTHYCERVAEISGGRRVGGVRILTRRLDDPLPVPDGLNVPGV